MKRWSFTVATVLLLALWLASGEWRAGWPIQVGGKAIMPGFLEGCFFVHDGNGWGRTGPWIEHRNPPWQSRWAPYALRWLPDVETISWAPMPLTEHIAYLPLYIPAALTGSLAAIAWRKRLRRRGDRACGKCGYDLRGLPVGERGKKPTCPECGA